MSTKDKIKVIGEDLDETKVARYLDMQPIGAENADFHVLTKAYRGLPLEAFERFLQMFRDAGRDINARDSKGRTLLQLAQENRSHLEYVDVLKKFGAQ
ncbi:MAG TPA: PA4642 family protein [Dongiaceae bacterium]|nr:PA4642 family protein [Dongiaceae bacterium]